jgi:alpha-mannosidase
MNENPKVHLICNAHLDPIWQWGWEEGMSEALATFEVAADLMEEYPEFVFNHNEAALYEWVKQYRPALFKRIRKWVKAGRWIIAGGWYLQPDCNLSGGESFVRHALIGRRFFRDEFGVTPKVAYNLDSFGHHGNMPQILRKCGYVCYVHFRPKVPAPGVRDHLYRWRGIDGSEIPAVRPPCGWYNSNTLEHLRQKVTRIVAQARALGRSLTVFWGAGDHGGGATRDNLELLRRMRTENPEILHSSLEAYWDAIRPEAKTAPVHEGELQKEFTGCYTSVIETKLRNRRGEGLLLMAERVATLDWWLMGSPYPREAMTRAWKRVLFNQFHDILPGSSVRLGYRDAFELYGEAMTLARETLAQAQMRLLRRRKKRAPLPLCIFNHQGHARRQLVEFEFMGATSSQVMQGKTVRIQDRRGRDVPVQMLAPQAKLHEANWRQRAVLMAELPALGMNEYRIVVDEAKPPRPVRAVGRRQDGNRLRFATRHYTVVFNTRTGLMEALHDGKGRKNLLAHPGGGLLVRQDVADAWGRHQRPYGNTRGRFACPSRKSLRNLLGIEAGRDAGPAVRIIEEGPVCTRIEVIQTYNRSVARIRYTLAAETPEIGIELLLDWSERCRALQYEFPTALKANAYRVEIPHGALTRLVDGDENPCGRWVCLLSQDGNRAFALVNNGVGGCDVGGGRLRQTLVRSPEFCRMGEKVRNDRMAEFMDIGEHQYAFALRFGNAEAVAHSLTALADELSMPTTAHVHLPLGPDPGDGIKAGADMVTIGHAAIQLAAMKPSEDGAALIARLVETRGAPARTVFRVAGTPKASLRFGPYEIKTLRLEQANSGRGWQECDLLEQAQTATPGREG